MLDSERSRRLKSDNVAGHVMHEERYELSRSTAEAINRAKARGGRVVAVGTTTLRALESASVPNPVPWRRQRSYQNFYLSALRFQSGRLPADEFSSSALNALNAGQRFCGPGRMEGVQKIRQAYARRSSNATDFSATATQCCYSELSRAAFRAV
jgi:hypothetical protein